MSGERHRMTQANLLETRLGRQAEETVKCGMRSRIACTGKGDYLLRRGLRKILGHGNWGVLKPNSIPLL